MKCPTAAGKECFGSSRFPIIISSPTCPPNSPGSVASWKSEKVDSFTGKSAVPSESKSLWAELPAFSAEKSMLNSPGPLPAGSMFGRKKRESSIPSSSSECAPSIQANEKTGKPSGPPLAEEIIWQSPHLFVCKVTGLCEASRLTTLNQLEWSELATYSGVILEQGKVCGLGKRRGWTLTLRIPGQNSGAVTVAKSLLSSMNFGVESISHTCCDGWIVTLVKWKSKDHLRLCYATDFGSPPMFRLINGILY